MINQQFKYKNCSINMLCLPNFQAINVAAHVKDSWLSKTLECTILEENLYTLIVEYNYYT